MLFVLLLNCGNFKKKILDINLLWDIWFPNISSNFLSGLKIFISTLAISYVYILYFDHIRPVSYPLPPPTDPLLSNKLPSNSQTFPWL